MFLFKFLCELNDLPAYNDKFDSCFFEAVDHSESPFLTEICPYSLHGLVVIIPYRLKLGVKISQSDVIIHCRFVDFDILDFSLKQNIVYNLLIPIPVSRNMDSKRTRSLSFILTA